MKQSMEVSSASAQTPVASRSDSETKKALLAAIKTEMAIFESKHVRGSLLQQIYSYLLTIPATSVETERAFLAAGFFFFILRSRHGDKSLDMLCVLRSHYRARRKLQPAVLSLPIGGV